MDPIELKQYLYHLLDQRFKEVWEFSGNTCSGTLTAWAQRELKPKSLRGLFWDVEASLKGLILEGKVIKVKRNYYPAKKESELSKIGGTRKNGIQKT